MEEYKFGGSKGSGAKSTKTFRLEVETPTTTTTTTAATTVKEDYLDHLDHLDYEHEDEDYSNYLDGANTNTAEENRVTEESSEDSHGHEDHYLYYGEEYPETSEEDLGSDELLHHNYDEDHEISEHSEAMTEHEYLDHDGANETYIESSRLHVDQAEARDSQLIENVRIFYFLNNFLIHLFPRVPPPLLLQASWWVC